MRTYVPEHDQTLPSEVWRLAKSLYVQAVAAGCKVAWFCEFIKTRLESKGAAWGSGARCFDTQFRDGPARFRLYDLSVLARLVSTAISCGVRSPEIHALLPLIRLHWEQFVPDRRGVLMLKAVALEVALHGKEVREDD